MIFFIRLLAQRNGPSNDAPPPYSPPLSDWYPAQPSAYQSPPTGYYGWIPPTNVFPDVPPGFSSISSSVSNIYLLLQKKNIFYMTLNVPL